MTSTRLSVFAMSALLCVAGAVLGNNGDDATLKEMAGYRQWNRVNEIPIVVENRSAFD